MKSSAPVSFVDHADKIAHIAWKASQSRTALSANVIKFRVVREFIIRAKSRGYLFADAPDVGGIVLNQADQLFHFAASAAENETNYYRKS